MTVICLSVSVRLCGNLIQRLDSGDVVVHFDVIKTNDSIINNSIENVHLFM